jgi:2'-5' RNA ligase
MVIDAKSSQYALVAYLSGPVAEFVEALRAELYPAHAHLAAHITVLPPRHLQGTEDEAKRALLSLSSDLARFEILLGDVESFTPATPTVFISVAKGAHRFRDMHVRFNSGALQCDEPWPYIPHLTIVKMDDFEGAARALAISRERWSNYSGEKTVRVQELTFVREGEAERWVDLETINLKEA